MDDCPEISLKKICCTCLSKDRTLFQLCRLPDGVNNLYLLLSYDSEAYREGFYKETASLFICWECKANMHRITGFRRQACKAQKQLSHIVDGRTDIRTQITCLSSLTTQNITYHEKVISEIDNSLTDNFIDCGPPTDIKSESEEDIPLSELHLNWISDNEPETINYKEINTSTEEMLYKLKKESKFKKRKKIKNGRNKNFFSTVMGSEGELDARVNMKIATSFKGASYKCNSCLQGFNSEAEFQDHNTSFHVEGNRTTTEILDPGSKPRKNPSMMDRRTPFGYLCTECNKYFDNKNQRWKHVQRHHREGFKCVTCGKRFAFKNNLTRHEQLHQAPPPREECPKCHKMIRVDLLKIHARIHADRETFTCVECAKCFISRASYEHHLKYTQAHALTDILKYKCTMCDKGYRSRGELRDHVNYQHMGKTQHKCPVCGKALATRRCITRHVRRAHDGVKESARDKICQLCGKAFRDKKGLREHELIHTGERPLSCEICGCTFRQSASLYTHRKRVHKIYPNIKRVTLLEP